MVRRAAAVAVALMLNATFVRAQDARAQDARTQDAVLTINVPSADVYKGPSNVTPVVGHVSQGAVLPVSRNLGSWVKVAWPAAPDGVGYVHVSMGRLGPAKADTAARATPASRASAAAAPPARTPVPVRTAAPTRLAPSTQAAVLPPSHVLGVGGLVGSMSSFGVTARAWHDNRVGLQLGVTRDAMTSAVDTARVTSLQFEPSVMYAFFDRVGDYVWIRPYAGSGVSFRNQTFSAAPGDPAAISESGVGFRVFGGTELTFASAPRFGVSADVAYRRFPTPFAGFEASPLSVSIAGHWYIK